MYFSKLNSLLILFVSVIAILYALPNVITKFNFNEISTYLPGKKVNLGLDLKGGSYILLQAEMKTSEIEFLDNTANSIRNDLRKEKIRYKICKFLCGQMVQCNYMVRIRHDHILPSSIATQN